MSLSLDIIRCRVDGSRQDPHRKSFPLCCVTHSYHTVHTQLTIPTKFLAESPVGLMFLLCCVTRSYHTVCTYLTVHTECSYHTVCRKPRHVIPYGTAHVWLTYLSCPVGDGSPVMPSTVSSTSQRPFPVLAVVLACVGSVVICLSVRRPCVWCRRPVSIGAVVLCLLVYMCVLARTPTKRHTRTNRWKSHKTALVLLLLLAPWFCVC